MKKNTRKTGTCYEDLAASYLEAQGMRILQRNFQRRIGEIDVIAQDKDTLVFVEVKYRSSGVFGDPVESVTFSKQQKIRRMAQMYMNIANLSEDTLCRFDVVAIRGDGEITHYKNAFGGML